MVSHGLLLHHAAAEEGSEWEHAQDGYWIIAMAIAILAIDIQAALSLYASGHTTAIPMGSSEGASLRWLECFLARRAFMPS